MRAPLSNALGRAVLFLVPLLLLCTVGGCGIDLFEEDPVDAGDTEQLSPPDVGGGSHEDPGPMDVGPTDPFSAPETEPPLFDEAVLSADGATLLLQRDEGEGPCLVLVDLDDGAITRPSGLCDLRWITPSPAGPTAWLLDEAGTEVIEISLPAGRVQRRRATDDVYSVLELSPAGGTLVLSNMPRDLWSESQYEWRIHELTLRHLAAIDLERGDVHEVTFPFAIRDVAFSPVDGAVLVTMSQWKEDGLPEAQIHFLNPVSGAVEDQIAFPNCADELRVQPGGTKAVLSPNRCFVHPILLAPPEVEEEWPDPEEEWEEWEDWPEGDPASIIDLETRRFVGNLPGFGPVAMAPDGATAVAFSRRETLMRQWNTFQQALVGLVIIRMADLYWQVIEYGEDEPDFFFADGGASLYLHDREPGHDRVVRMACDSLALTPLAGPATGLDNRAVHADGEHVYAVHQGALRHIESGNEAIEEIPLPFDAAQVFTRPSGDVVVLATDGDRLLILAAETHAALRDLSL